MPGCSTDEGRPLGTGLQERVSNQPRRLYQKQWSQIWKVYGRNGNRHKRWPLAAPEYRFQRLYKAHSGYVNHQDLAGPNGSFLTADMVFNKVRQSVECDLGTVINVDQGEMP